MPRQIDPNLSPRIANRKANFQYTILEKLECGIVLTGSEVKSIRKGSVSLAEGFASIDPRDHELYLHDVDIAPYSHAQGPNAHTPKRVRKLLAHRRQILKLMTQSTAKGFTLVPLAMYFVRGKVKVEIALCEGKSKHDKRDTIKEREAQRDMRRGMTRKII